MHVIFVGYNHTMTEVTRFFFTAEQRKSYLESLAGLVTFLLSEGRKMHVAKDFFVPRYNGSAVGFMWKKGEVLPVHACVYHDNTLYYTLFHHGRLYHIDPSCVCMENITSFIFTPGMLALCCLESVSTNSQNPCHKQLDDYLRFLEVERSLESIAREASDIVTGDGDIQCLFQSTTEDNLDIHGQNPATFYRMYREQVCKCVYQQGVFYFHVKKRDSVYSVHASTVHIDNRIRRILQSEEVVALQKEYDVLLSRCQLLTL